MLDVLLPEAPDEELGVLEDEEPDALGVLEDDEPDELGELDDPVAAGEDGELPLAPVEPLLLLPLVCAIAVLARNAAATAALMSFNVMCVSLRG